MNVSNAVRTFLELGAVVAAARIGAKNPITSRDTALGPAPGGWRQHHADGHLQKGLDRLCSGEALEPCLWPGSVALPGSESTKPGRLACADVDKAGGEVAVLAAYGPALLVYRKPDNPDKAHVWFVIPIGFQIGNGKLYAGGRHWGDWRGLAFKGKDNIGSVMRMYPGEIEALAQRLNEPLPEPLPEDVLTPPAWVLPVEKAGKALRKAAAEPDHDILDILRPLAAHTVMGFWRLFAPLLADAYAAGGGDPHAIAGGLETIQHEEEERRASMPWYGSVEKACTALRGLRGADAGGDGRNCNLLAVLRPLERYLGDRASFEGVLVAAYSEVFSAGEGRNPAKEIGRALDKIRDTNADGSPRSEGPGESSSSQDQSTTTSAPAVEVEIVAGKTLRGVEYCMGKLGHETMWNTRSVRFDWREQGGGVWDWKELDDLKAHSFRREIEERFATLTARGAQRPLSFGKDAFFDGLGALADSKRFDPFVEWLRQLPAWDGEERLRFIIDSVFEVEDGELYPDEAERLRQWQSGLPLVAAVARALKPGAVADVVSTILGPQGIGKSRFFRELLPPEGREEWFSDSLPLDASEKEWAEALSGPVIVESSELSGLRRADTEKMKARLSRRVMRYRPAYARLTGTFPLRAAVVATCNRETPLPNDESGNRRFVVCRVRCVRPDAWTWLNAHREQLWAEALHAVEVGGETGAIPPELAPVLAAANSGLRDSNEAAEHVVTELAPWLDEEPRAMTEIAAQIARRAACGQGLEDTEIGLFVARETLAVMSSKARQSELGRALTVCGYRSKRSTCNGVRASRWARDEAA